MAPVAGKPFLEWQIEFLVAGGVSEITLCVGYASESIEKHFGDGSGFGLEIEYSRETEPLGTGGALRLAWDRERPRRGLVLNGDSLLGLAPRELVRFHRARRSQVTMALVSVEDRSSFGSVDLGDDGRIRGFLEKEKGAGPGWVNGGMYLIEGAWFEKHAPAAGQPFSLERDLFPGGCANPDSPFFGLETGAPFIDIGTPENLDRAQKILPEYF